MSLHSILSLSCETLLGCIVVCMKSLISFWFDSHLRKQVDWWIDPNFLPTPTCDIFSLQSIQSNTLPLKLLPWRQNHLRVLSSGASWIRHTKHSCFLYPSHSVGCSLVCIACAITTRLAASLEQNILPVLLWAFDMQWVALRTVTCFNDSIKLLLPPSHMWVKSGIM